MTNLINFREMKAKITLLTMLVCFTYTSELFAQAQNPECMTNLSIFSEHAKVKNYDAAYGPWKMVKETCPQLHAAIYVYGEKILKHKIKSNAGEEKTAAINELIAVYNEGNNFFPKKFTKGKVLTSEALIKYDEKLANDEQIYNILHKGFTEDRKNFINPKAMYLYFSTLVDLHVKGKKDLQEVFNTYDDVTDRIDDEYKRLSGILDKLQPKEEAEAITMKEKRKLKFARVNSESYGKIQGSIDAKLGDLSDCENLIPLYEKNFEAKKGESIWLKRAAGRMDGKECTDDPLFVKLVEALHALEPSAKSAYYLAILYDKRGQSSDAIKYYNESVDLEEDPYEKGKALLKIAYKYKKKSKSTARKYAQRVLEYQPSNGRAYLLIASLYGNSANQCGSDSFEKRAIYWKAAEVARRAGRVDPSVKVQASKSAASYSARAPSKTDIFQKGMAGKTVTFNCWVGGSVKVPNL